MDANLHVFRDPPLDGPTNMARDEHLLYADGLAPACVRIYGWEPPTISLGYFQSHAEVARLPADVRGLAVVRRMTGGGAILHDQEITYCLVVHDALPAAHRAPVELYRLVHRCFQAALHELGVSTELAPESYPLPTPRSGPFFCFERPGRTDLLLGGRKLLGSAQRRIPGRVLQHGSLLLDRRFPSHPGTHLGGPDTGEIERTVGVFLRDLASALDLNLCDEAWTPERLGDVARRRDRFAGDQWTRKH
ncbi:MAG: lipoate--protein ligase family protein [Phycisphaerae bacterium]